jgi:fido (protein-threonine AMPylation protein)
VEHPCPQGWQYEQHSKRKKLAAIVEATLRRLRSKKPSDALATARDSRPIHGELFGEMTPPHFPYFAGHYRGERFRCLETCEVGVPGDARVGAPSVDVLDRMKELSDAITLAVSEADKMLASTALSEPDRLLHIVGVACLVFDVFLQVHPYANGNGHAARFIMWAILGRYGFWPVRWTVEPRPPDPPYTTLLLRHRAGDRKPLVEYVLNCIK